ncbi:MAG TPA: ABC transporter permease [Steroidobacteraceae bacterium]|nr:ABC transporter permease [Steroidobacteraceae bacterium]
MTAGTLAASGPRGHKGLPIYFGALIVLLYLPLAVLLLFSFNAGTSLSFPLEELTLHWYQRLFDSPEVLRAARNSIVVGVGSGTAATVLGTAVALLLSRFRFRGESFLFSLAMLPLVVPAVVLAVALLVLFLAVGMDRSLWTVAIGHTVVALPFVVLIVTARLAGFDRDLEDAAMDLGATYARVIGLIILPLIAPAVVSAWLVAFTVSLDEFALALFLAGNEPTFPVYLFSQLRFASRLPVMIALAVLLMAGTLVLVLLAEWIRRRDWGRQSR